jgi:hypothetical protein
VRQSYQTFNFFLLAAQKQIFHVILSAATAEEESDEYNLLATRESFIAHTHTHGGGGVELRRHLILDAG